MERFSLCSWMMVSYSNSPDQCSKRVDPQPPLGLGAKVSWIQNWSTANAQSSVRIMQDYVFVVDHTKAVTAWLGSSDSSAIAPSRFPLFLSLNFSLMEKNFEFPGRRKGTWGNSLVKKKSYGKMELWSCLKMAESSGTKYWTCLIKFLVRKWKICHFHFYLKTEETFWPTPYVESCPF